MIKRLLSVALSVCMILSTVVMPITATADTVEGSEFAEVLKFDFNNETDGVVANGFLTESSNKDTYPVVDGMGKVYQIDASTSVIGKFADVELPNDGFEITTKFSTLNPSGKYSAGVFVVTDGNNSTSGANFLAIRPLYDSNSIEILANNGSSSVQTKSFSMPDGITFTNGKWYSLRMIVDGGCLTVYVSDGSSEYKVIDGISEVGSASVSAIAKVAHKTGLRPYNSKCQYDDFTIKVKMQTYTTECEATLKASEFAQVIEDESASGGKAVTISGTTPNAMAEFTVTPPASGTYDIYLSSCLGPENGTIQLEVYSNSQPNAIIGSISQYAQEKSYSEKKVGNFTFSSTEPATFRITVIEKAEGSSNYKAVVDKIILKTQPEDINAKHGGDYVIREDSPQQTIWGLGVEIQSDSIESGNNGINDLRYVSVPHDLVPSERDRLATELLKGFRYLRLAGGLYYRGSTDGGKTFKERWDTQNEELKEMVKKSGIEGIDLEYWSPLPYWKASESLMEDKENGLRGLKCFGEDFDNDPDYQGDVDRFLKDFGNAISQDIDYLEQNIAPVVQFGLQNEPNAWYQRYPSCGYTMQEYYDTFKVVAPILKKNHPDLLIHADSSSSGAESGQHGWGKMLAEDKETLKYVDAWSVHRVGTDSNEQYTSRDFFNRDRYDLPIFNTEFEYLSGGTNDYRCINTAQSIMNWMTFENAPTWYWLHALKPTYNSEATGYSLGFWRPEDDNTTTNIEKGHWVYNDKNFNAIAGFLKYMPWDSTRLEVEESDISLDNRIMSWKTPDGRMVFVITNRNSASDFEFNINVGKDRTFDGYLYSPYVRDESLGVKSGEDIVANVEPLTIQFWVEQQGYVKEGFEINSLQQSETEAEINITHPEPDGESVAIGVYDENGKLLKVAFEDILSGVNDYTFDISGVTGASIMKAFIFDKDKITPLCESKSKYFVGAKAQQDLTMFYTQAATAWEEDALPIGNGYMGAMLFGGVTKDTIQFNEETMFSGKPSEPDATAYTHLEKIRQLIDEGNLYDAQQVADTDWLKTASYGTTTNFGSYQNFGNVSVTLGGSGNATDYRRELDLNNAVSTVSYNMDGAAYKRTYFASYPKKVVAMKYECDKENAYDAEITFDKGHTDDVIAAVGNDELTLSGSLTNLDYEAKLKVIPQGGTVTANGSSLKVSGATSFVILLTAGTDYLATSPTYRGKDYKKENTNVISACTAMTFDELMAEHVADYTGLFGRNTFTLKDDRADVPTDRRLSEYKQGQDDKGLEVMLYQYGRYMLVSSSREGTLPANLQGVWNNSNDPEWGSMFCYNINMNMNYWCAQNTNLSECHTSEINFIDGLRESGRESAKSYFDCGGWFTSKKSDIWGFTMPYGESVYGLSIGGSGWLCEDVWEYYNFNRDEDYLREQGYPIMREAAQFYLDYLTENNKGELVSSPSSSPENSFWYNGKKVNISEGTEYDHRIIQELFTNCIRAAEILGGDDDFKEQLEDALAKLAQPKIGSNGELLEWADEYTKVDPSHRHLSFIYGIHPAQVYDTREDKEIAEAAKKTLLSRGEGSTGWSTAWRIPLWARYFDGENAYHNVERLLKQYTNGNLFCVHPPFQIDGNLGFTAGIAEMLIQSNYDKEIILLPAIPSKWEDGYVTGLRARGDFTVDIQWGDGKLIDAVIYGDAGNSGTVEYNGKVINFTIPSEGRIVLNDSSF